MGFPAEDHIHIALCCGFTASWLPLTGGQHQTSTHVQAMSGDMTPKTKT
jgi:hypothetical protein